MANMNLFYISIIPSLLLIWYIYVNDKKEKEPWYLLTLLFIGGIVSCTISIIVSSILKKYIPFLNITYKEMNTIQILFKSFVFVALLEELSKWIINYLGTWNNKHYNSRFDQIIYASFVSLGFATIENILYASFFHLDGFIPILIRGITSIPSHLVFAVFMGYFLDLAKIKNSIKYKLLSIFIPTLLHFIYNLLLINQTTLFLIIFIIYIVTLYLISSKIIKNMSTK